MPPKKAIRKKSAKKGRTRRNKSDDSSKEKGFDINKWKPKTELGKKVKSGEITDIDEILDNGLRILEPEIVDILLPELENELLLVGQSRGKFGGGQRRVFKQTQKKTREGNKPKFATFAVVGNKNGYVGIGFGKSKETVPAREKSLRNAKLNIVKIRRGAGSWEDASDEAHSIPFSITGRCGSIKITLLPAPKGTGLCAGEEVAKILKMAGVENIWSRTEGKTKTRMNVFYAIMDALKKLMSTKIREQDNANLSIVEGRNQKIEKKSTETEEETKVKE